MESEPPNTPEGARGLNRPEFTRWGFGCLREDKYVKSCLALHSGAEVPTTERPSCAGELTIVWAS